MKHLWPYFAAGVLVGAMFIWFVNWIVDWLFDNIESIEIRIENED